MSASQRPEGPPSGGPPAPEVDLDRLADYLGGALDGTAEWDEVTGLVDTEPAWQQARDDLADADPAVRAQLTELARTPEPMPTDVLFRLTAAVRAAGSTPDGRDEADETVTRVADRVTARSRRRRHARWAMAAAGAVVLASFGLVGARELANDSGQHAATGNVRTSSEGGGDSARAPHPKIAPNREKIAPRLAGTPVTASGRDYTRASLSTLQAQPGRTGPALDAAERTRMPAALDRLAAPQQLQRCLAAVGSTHAGRTVVVDYARFRGSPALVIEIAPAGFVVVGQDCGVRGADELYATH